MSIAIVFFFNHSRSSEADYDWQAAEENLAKLAPPQKLKKNFLTFFLSWYAIHLPTLMTPVVQEDLHQKLPDLPARLCEILNKHIKQCPYIICIPYISELTPGTNRSLVSFTSLVISSDNVNRGLVLFLLLCLIYKPGHN